MAKIVPSTVIPLEDGLSPNRSDDLPKHLPNQLLAALVIKTAQSMKILKPLNFSIFRWNLLWLFIIWVLITLPIWIRYATSCWTSFHVILAFLCWFDLLWIFALLFSALHLMVIRRGIHTDHRLKYPIPSPKLFHLVMMTIYRDDMNVVFNSMDSLAQQTEAKRIIMVIAYESRTPDREERHASIEQRYRDSFAQILFTIHPVLDHEIASHAANCNWSLREVVKDLFIEQGYTNANEFMVTTTDCDCLFHPKYFEALSADYLQMLEKNLWNAHHTIWQPPLFYNWNLDESSFISRVTGLVRSIMTMGMLIPYNINPMSTFSFSLTLAIRSEYWHPQMFVDDVGFLITSMSATGERIRVRGLPVPVRSGPTSGATWLKDIKEWFIQVRRWGLGIADNFHYFTVKIRQYPIHGAILFFCNYFVYYGVVLCASSLFNIVSAFYPLMCSNTEIEWVSRIHTNNYTASPGDILLFFGLIVPYFLFGCMFMLDTIWCRFILGVREDIFILRNCLHYLLAGPVVIAYCSVYFLAYHVLAIRGKGACIHRVAGKAKLGEATTNKY